MVLGIVYCLQFQILDQGLPPVMKRYEDSGTRIRVVNSQVLTCMVLGLGYSFFQSFYCNYIFELMLMYSWL